MSSDYPFALPEIFPIEPYPVEQLSTTESLEIIAQPCYTSKIRYHSEYKNNKNRRGVLHSRNNPNYQYPAIRIPQRYRNVTQQYYIRICLVTVINDKTTDRYVHPYDLENVDDPNDKALWFPIKDDDIDGIKSFPKLRIVKKTAEDLKNYGNFRVFDSRDEISIPQSPTAKDTIKEFNLEKAQLAFSIGEKMIRDGDVTTVLYSSTTVFSDEIIEITTKDYDSDNTPSESTTTRTHTSKSSICCMYKYAPQKGYTNTNDEVLIFYTNKIKPEKYGELQVTFECDTENGRWSEPVLDLKVKDQMVSFRTPSFPFLIDTSKTVDIILRQRKRTLEPLRFHYYAREQCPTCQQNTVGNPILPLNPRKRRRSSLFSDDEEADKIPSIQENNPELDAPAVSSITTPVPLPTTQEDLSQQILDILAESIASLFCDENFIPILRICRTFIRKRPELLHEGISNNHSAIIPKFVSVASIEILQKKNDFGETVLLHAARLNRIDIVKAVLEKKNSDVLLEDKNDKGQNIFHLLALNTNSNELLELFIKHLVNNSIDITEKFDYVDEENQTPLQIAILNNNLSVTHHLLKYFRNNTPVTSNHATDHFIDRAARYIDLIKFE